MFYYYEDEILVRDIEGCNWGGIWEKYNYYIATENGNFADTHFIAETLNSLGIEIVVEDSCYLISDDDIKLIKLAGSNLFTNDAWRNVSQYLSIFRIIRE